MLDGVDVVDVVDDVGMLEVLVVVVEAGAGEAVDDVAYDVATTMLVGRLAGLLSVRVLWPTPLLD